VPQLAQNGDFAQRRAWDAFIFNLQTDSLWERLEKDFQLTLGQIGYSI
jgi:hypothetical protein